MIVYLHGKLAYTTQDSAIIECAGVGYEVYMPARELGELPDSGKEVLIFTSHQMKEGSEELYGFLEKSEVGLFNLLLNVPSVGPKSAISIMSVLDENALKFAILARDTATLSKVPGVGKKTSEKIIIEIGSKVEKMAADENISVFSSAALGSKKKGSKDENSAERKVKEEAVEALAALGYTSTDALKAVNAVEYKEGMDSGEILSCALKNLAD